MVCASRSGEPRHCVGMSATVADYMTKVAFSVGDDQPLADAVLRMSELNVRHLPVIRGSKLVGILSQRDIALLKAVSDAHLSELTAGQAMSRNPYTVAPEDSLREVAAAMASERYGAAIVVSGGDVVGIFTTTDGMRALAESGI